MCVCVWSKYWIWQIDIIFFWVANAFYPLKRRASRDRNKFHQQKKNVNEKQSSTARGRTRTLHASLHPTRRKESKGNVYFFVFAFEQENKTKIVHKKKKGWYNLRLIVGFAFFDALFSFFIFISKKGYLIFLEFNDSFKSWFSSSR